MMSEGGGSSPCDGTPEIQARHACQGEDGSGCAKHVGTAVCRCGLLRDVSGVGPGVLDGGAPWPVPASRPCAPNDSLCRKQASKPIHGLVAQALS